MAVPAADQAIPTRQRAIISAATLLISLVVAVLSVPRALAYGEVTSWRSFSQIVPKAGAAETETEEALDAYRLAVAALPGDARLQSGRARLALSLDGRQDEAIDALRAALAASPDQALGWSFLAHAGDRYKTAAVPVMPALRLAYILGPYEGKCSRLRTTVALAHWDEMPDELKSYLGRDVQNLWNDGQARQLLADLYLSSGYGARAFVRSTFSSAAELAHFDLILKAEMRGRARAL
jgi:tetratricopeptide (TPR) repeat protein